MTTHRFERWLAAAIELGREERDQDDDPIRDVETFEAAGVLTTDRGLVVRFEDGAEIQVTLVRSRGPRNDRSAHRMVGEPDGDDE